MRSILVIFILWLSVPAMSQTLGDYEEVVYLKNGSIIRGIIIEEIPGKALKIQTSERNVFVYQLDEVEKIAKEIPTRGSAKNGKTDSRKDKGFEMYIDEGLALLIDDQPYPLNHLTLTPGYKFNRTVFLGGGVGLLARSGFVTASAFADLRLTFTRTKVAPVLNIKAGYLSPNFVSSGYSDFYSSSTDHGGFLVHVAPGMAINLKKNLDLNFYTGYQLGSQIASFNSYYTGAGTDIGLLHMYTLTAGIKF